MKNTLSKSKAIKELNNCFLSSHTYNEAVDKFFTNCICPWLEISSAHLPTDPQNAKWEEVDSTKRIIPKRNLIMNAQLHYR